MAIDREYEHQLEQWGKWMRRNRATAGYPHRSVEGRLLDDGVFLPRDTRSMVPEALYCPPEVEAVEHAVLRILQFKRGKLYQLVLVQEYVYPYGVQAANADKLKMSVNRYKTVLSYAKEMVVIQLDLLAA
jgi:hypothetical protein